MNEEFCIRHPDLCPKYYEVNPTTFGNKSGRRARSSKPLKEQPPRRFGIREAEEEEKPRPTPRRFGIRELDVPTSRRFGIREEEDEVAVPRTSFGTQKVLRTQLQTARPESTTQSGVKRISRKIQRARSEALKKLDIETEVVEHSADEFLNAVLAQASYEYAYKGKKAAERYIKNRANLLPELNDIEINSDFSNNNHMASRNVRTGQPYMSYRGSDGEFFDPEANIESLMRGKGSRLKNATDWSTNLHTLAGKEHKAKRYKDAVKVAEKWSAYNNKPVSELITNGHSLGGGQSDHVSEVLGSKSVSFDPARNPFAKRPVHHQSKIKSYGTWFDPVGLARNAHARYRGGEPEHIEMKNYWAVPGHESGFLEHHKLAEQFIDPIELKGDKLVSTRVKPWRNLSNMIGGATRAGLTKAATGSLELANLALPFALTPEYSTKAETKYRKGEAFADNAEISLAMSESLFKVNPMFYLLDEPAMMATILDFDPMLPPESKRWVQKQLGIKIKEEPVRYTPAPSIIRKLQWENRRKEEEQLKSTQELADAYGISLNEALNLTPETDPGTPIVSTTEEDIDGTLAAFGERNRLARQQLSEERAQEWYKYYRPEENPYSIAGNPYALGSQERKDYEKKRIEWDQSAKDRAKQILAEINQAKKERRIQDEAEQRIKYEQSPQYSLEMKEEQMAVPTTTPRRRPLEI